MKKIHQKYLNIMASILLIATIVVMPLSVLATPQEDIDKEREDIRAEREATREEGIKAGNKLEVDYSATSVADILMQGDLSNEQIADIIGKI